MEYKSVPHLIAGEDYLVELRVPLSQMTQASNGTWSMDESKMIISVTDSTDAAVPHTFHQQGVQTDLNYVEYLIKYR